MAKQAYCINETQDHKSKMFQESENEFAHSIMETMASYCETVVKHPLLSVTPQAIHKTELRDYRNGTAVDTFLRLPESTHRPDLDLENTQYCDLIHKVVGEIPGVNDETLINLLAALCLWPVAHSTEMPNFKTLWNALDNECVNRMENWSTNRQLLVADYWFHLKLSRISKYNIAMINGLVKRMKLLLPFQIVQLLFYINLQRHVRPRNMHYIEVKLNAILPSLNINEIGIVCLGFFKTKSKILDSLVLTNIIHFTMKHISEVEPISLSSILKQLRNSSTPEHTNDFSALLSRCSPFVKKWPPVVGSHLILLGSYVDLYHPMIIDAVTANFLQNMKEIRLKDLAKLLFYTAKHRHLPQQGKKVFEILINELSSLHRQSEMDCYPHCLISSLLYLAYFDIYPEDLISKALNPSFIQMIQEKSSLNYCQEIVTLHYSVEIEVPNNKGEKLPTEELQTMLLDLHTSIEVVPNSFLHRFQKVVIEELRKLFQKKSFIVRRVLPYSSNPDIIMCKRKGGKFLPIPEKTEDLPIEKIIKPGHGDYQWFCLTLLPKSSYGSGNQLLGLPAMKKRQLKKLGYRVIEIPWFQFYDLSSKGKQKYLQERLS